jgi:hypothetical protein
MQVVKCELLKNSLSEDIRELYASLEKRYAEETGRRWRYTFHATMITSSYNLKALFPGQVSKRV